MSCSVIASTSVLISVDAALLQPLLQQYETCLAEQASDMLQGGARCPDLPLGLCPRLWDERHIPSRDADDAAIYGAGLARKQNWPAWLLVRYWLYCAACMPPRTFPNIMTMTMCMCM